MALKQCEEEASEGLYLNDKGLAAKYAIQNVWTSGPHVVHSVNALELVRL